MAPRLPWCHRLLQHIQYSALFYGRSRWVFLPVLLVFTNSKLVRESPILNRVRKTTLTVLNSGILVELISRIL